MKKIESRDITTVLVPLPCSGIQNDFPNKKYYTRTSNVTGNILDLCLDYRSLNTGSESTFRVISCVMKEEKDEDSCTHHYYTLYC